MSRILKGKEVADALTKRMQQDVEQLKAAGTTPVLCIFRVGERQVTLIHCEFGPFLLATHKTPPDNSYFSKKIAFLINVPGEYDAH